MTQAQPSWDLTRTLLAVVTIGGLIATSFWVLRPFLPSVVWAAMIVVATWPVLEGVEARLWQSRALAVAVMTLGMLLVVAAPLTVAVVVPRRSRALPTLHVGEQVILFLARTGRWRYEVLGGAQGKFSIQTGPETGKPAVKISPAAAPTSPNS